MMLSRTETLAIAVQSWLEQFETALAGGEGGLLRDLFYPDCHWRDVLAFTWQIRTINGPNLIARELKAIAERARPKDFKLNPRRTAPRLVSRAGTEATEAIFEFETVDGYGSGVLRLIPDAGDGDKL